MSNTVYCGLINININTDVQENVQIGCTGYVHIAAVWMMENNGYWMRDIKSSLANPGVTPAKLSD